MSAPFVCARCRRPVGKEAGRFVARLEIVHDASPLEITAEELRRDHGAEIRRLLAAMAARDPRELEEEVALRRERRLCAACRREVIAAFEATRRRPRRRPR